MNNKLCRNDVLIKNLEQIDGIRCSCRLAASTLNHLTAFVKAGTTTENLNKEAETYIRDNGAVPAPLGYHGFPAATCISLNEVVCHGIPSQTTLKEGDILNIDVTTILDGYYGDCSRMYAVAEISKEARQLCQGTYGLLWSAIAGVGPGARFCDPGNIIEGNIRAAGLPWTIVENFCGHGVGLEFHEEPQVPHFHNDDKRIMKPGMIFTIEPMINAGVKDVVVDEGDGWTARTTDGMMSAQYEHTLLVTKTGHEVLTKPWDKGWGNVL